MKALKSIIILAITVSIIALFLLITTAASAETGMFHLNMKEGDNLDTETSLGEGQSILVEADYTEDPFLHTRNNKQWVDAGTWTAPDRESNFSWIDKGFYTNFWYQIIQEGDYDATPEFQCLISAGSNNSYIQFEMEDPDDDDIYEFATRDFSSNPNITVGKTDTINWTIRYRGYEDCRIYFDNETYDSGVSLESNFLRIYNMSAKEDTVYLELYDSFETNFNKIIKYINLSVDDTPANISSVSTETGNQHTVNNTTVTSTIITWTLNNSLAGGEEVEAWVKYMKAKDWEERGIKRSCTAESSGNIKPVAVITSIDPDEVNEGEEITFNASGSHDQDGTISTYLWESDIDDELYRGQDDSFSTDQLSVGEHEISLTVEDNAGKWSDTVQETITVKKLEENALPVVNLSSPEDGAVIQHNHTTLEWEGNDEDEGDDLTYDLYFGTDSDAETLLEENLTSESFDVEELLDQESYYWKVIVKDGKDETESDIRSFSIEIPPENNPPGIELRSPVKFSTIKSTTVTLIWRGEDEDDADDLTYDVYLDTDPNATTLVDSDVEQDSYPVLDLEKGETYYWKVIVKDGEDETSSEIWEFGIKEKKDDNDEDFIPGFGLMISAISILAAFVLKKR